MSSARCRVPARAGVFNNLSVTLSKEHAVPRLPPASLQLGVLNPLPNDGYNSLYSSAIAAVASGTPIPNAAVISTLPAAPTATDHLPDNHVVAPDRIALVDIKLKSTILKCITSKGRRNHYKEVVGPSGIQLLMEMERDSRMVDSLFSQSTHSRRIKAQIAEVLAMKLTAVSLEEFDGIKDTLEDLNS